MSSLLYLAAPAWLFLLGFCRPELGWPLSALLLWALLCCRDQRPIELRELWPAMAGGMLMAGVTGFVTGPFPSDWIKHWALMDELSRRGWPVVLELQQQTQYLRFYLGAYLLPAGLSKLTGLPVWIPATLCFGLGYVMVFRSAIRAVDLPRKAWLIPPLLLAMAGADAYAEQLLRGSAWPAVPWLGIHFEAWAYNSSGLPLEYSSILTALAWVPHQAIATFLVCGLMVAPPSRRRAGPMALGLGLLAFWSPYGLIGLLPLALLEAWSRRQELRQAGVIACLLFATLFTLLVAWYLSADLPQAGACFTCVPERLARWHDYLLFLLVELLPFVLLLRGRLWRDVQCRVALLCLLVLPLLHGETPDFVMRASLGPLFLLSLRSIEALMSWTHGLRTGLVFLAGLALAMPTALSEAVYLRQGGAAHRELASPDPLAVRWLKLTATERSYSADQFLDLCGWQFRGQYFSRQLPAPLKVAPATVAPSESGPASR